MRVFIVGVLFFTVLHTQAASSPYDMHLHVYPNGDQFQIVADYKVGHNPPSFDKQFVRDWLTASGWDKQSPAPTIPADVCQKTADKYQEAYLLLAATSA